MSLEYNFTMASVNSLRRLSEKYHMQVHTSLGVICALSIKELFPNYNIWVLIFTGIAGNIIPDIDHLLNIFIYGRKTEYSKLVKKYLRSKELRNTFNFIKLNHKNNQSILSHNILTPIISYFLFNYFQSLYPPSLFALFFLSFTCHFLYDFIEDILFFKKPNPNWFFKYNFKIGEYRSPLNKKGD